MNHPINESSNQGIATKHRRLQPVDVIHKMYFLLTLTCTKLQLCMLYTPRPFEVAVCVLCVCVFVSLCVAHFNDTMLQYVCRPLSEYSRWVAIRVFVWTHLLSAPRAVRGVSRLPNSRRFFSVSHTRIKFRAHASHQQTCCQEHTRAFPTTRAPLGASCS